MTYLPALGRKLSWVAFLKMTTAGVMLFPLLGGQLLLARAAQVAQIAVNGRLLLTGVLPGRHDNALVAVQAGQRPRVVIGALPPQTVIAPSPDGRYIALAEEDRGLWLIGSDGRHLHRLIQPPSGKVFVNGVAWSPDGSTLVYALSLPVCMTAQCPVVSDDRAGLWLVGRDGRHQRRLVSYKQLGFDSATGLSWSSDGQAIAANLDPDVVAVDARTGRVRRAVVPLGGEGAVFSPASPALAYYTNEYPLDGEPAAGGPYVLHVQEPAGGHTRVVGRDTNPSPAAPIWSPDGKTLAYLWGWSPTKVEIHALNIATGRARVLLRLSLHTPYGGFTAFAWMHGSAP